MEHSAAIVEDADKAINNAAHTSLQQQPDAAPVALETPAERPYDDRKAADDGEGQHTGSHRHRKRELDAVDSKRQQFRSNVSGRNDGKRHKKGDMGRGAYFRDGSDKRAKTDSSRQKREISGDKAPGYGTQFSKEEIEAEERKPKRKVAVLIGYSGTGYKGMQISASERTIEGDLFQAFVKAGAISKANADDPKKASLVRCARTDKGVHAAGNMISLKLIVEDPDIVQKINEQLSQQIRVWGIERTIGSFSCYQACDSRWYEYLIPSHCFLPPHPSSFLAKKLEELADEAADRGEYESRQAEVRGFWEKVEEEDIKPILNSIDEDIRWNVIKALQGEDEASAKAVKAEADVEQPLNCGTNGGGKMENGIEEIHVEARKTTVGAIAATERALSGPTDADETGIETAPTMYSGPNVDGLVTSAVSPPPSKTVSPPSSTLLGSHPLPPQLSPEESARQLRLKVATKRLRMAYIAAKRRYRIPKERIERIQQALQKFVGTKNYHNYTVQKTFKDPSAKRHIKSFVVSPHPILIGEGGDEEKTEWLSLKVHGQSFMMHQIRKMIGMASLLCRCGSDLNTLDDSLGSQKYSVPKVPGLGLLLERPVFDSYNSHQAPKHAREPLAFSKYEKEMEAFKQREIYQRIFREEEEKNEFGRFFNQMDNFKEPYFLYVTSKGLAATKGAGTAENGSVPAVPGRSVTTVGSRWDEGQG